MFIPADMEGWHSPGGQSFQYPAWNHVIKCSMDVQEDAESISLVAECPLYPINETGEGSICSTPNPEGVLVLVEGSLA